MEWKTLKRTYEQDVALAFSNHMFKTTEKIATKAR